MRQAFFFVACHVPTVAYHLLSFSLTTPFRKCVSSNLPKKANNPNPSPTGKSGSDYLCLVPVTGLEPVRHRWRWILSPLRLPFHHTGRCFYSIVQIREKCKKKFSSPPGKARLCVFPGEGFCGRFIRRRFPRSDIGRSRNLPGCAVRGRSRCRGTAEKARYRLPAQRRRPSAFPDFPEG